MEFNQSILTQKGRTLMAKAISGRANIVFTKMQSSSTQYQMTQLEMLTSLSNVKQRADVVAEKNNGVTVKVKGTFDNYNLNSGYDFRTVGLYANDPDEGEILYSVSTASVSGYMPPNTGISATGIDITFYVEVGNADKVNLEIDPAGFATKAELRALEVNVAYANSADGSVDFSKFKPKENLVSASLISKLDNTKSFTLKGWGAQLIKPEELSKILTPGKSYTIMYKAEISKKSTSSVPGQLIVGFILRSGAMKKDINMYISNFDLTGDTRYFTTTFTMPTDSDDYALNYYTNRYDSDADNDTVTFTDFKISEQSDDRVYLPSKSDNYRYSFVNYIGHSIKSSTNPNDYKWQVNPEWQRAQTDYEKASMIKNSIDNLVSDGDFSKNGTGWTLGPQTQIVDGHLVKSSVTSSSCIDINLNGLSKIYVAADIWTENSNNMVSLNIFDKGGYDNKRLVDYTRKTVVTSVSNIINIIDGCRLDLSMSGYGNYSAYFDNVKVYNLTAIFGAGNEPTLEEFERLLAINVNSPTIYSQSIARAKLNAHPINSLYYTESAESPETTFGGKWTKLGTEAKFSKTFNVWQRTQGGI